MIEFTAPQNLNGAELRNELRKSDIQIADFPYGITVEADNKTLWLDINPEDEAKAALVVAAHNGTTVAPEPTVADKLASVGLSVDDLKAALGL